MQLKSERKRCPVCKAPVSEDKLVPLYGRGMADQPVARKAGQELPNRPQGHRLLVQQQGSQQEGQPGQRDGFAVSGGLAALPQLLGFQVSQVMNQVYTSQGLVNQVLNSERDSMYGDLSSPEQQQQAFLSRLLLMLGSFVIMCLLLF